MNQVIEECLKHQIDIRNVVVLDITNNEIEKITAEELGQFINLQALVAHNNKIELIDITKNPYLSVLVCQQNKLTQGLNLMQKVKQSVTPSFINLLDNVFDNLESGKILHFINVSEEMLKSDAEMIGFYGSKEVNQPTTFLPIMAYSKDEKHSLGFLKIAHIQTAEEGNLIELLIHNEAIVQNYIINKTFEISNFRNLFKKHYHNQYNYLRDMSHEFSGLSPETNKQGKNPFFSIAFLLKSTIVLILIGGIWKYTEKVSAFISAEVKKFLKDI